MQNNSEQLGDNVEQESVRIDLVQPILFDWKHQAKPILSVNYIEPDYDLEDITINVGSSPVSPNIHKNDNFVQDEMIADYQGDYGFVYTPKPDSCEQQSECAKLLYILNQYQKNLNYFFQVNCINEVKNYIALSPKKPLNPLSGQLKGKKNLLNLDMQKINMVLQEQANNILFPAVINLALHLGIGKISGNYDGDRTSLARYDILIIDFPKLLTKGVKYSAEADYLVEINYIAPNGRVVRLLELKFIYREEPIQYLFKGADFVAQVAAMVSHSLGSNSINLPQFLCNHWQSSVLQSDSIRFKLIDSKDLKFITENVVHKILTSNNFHCQEVRREILKKFQHEYKNKLLKLGMYNKVFNSCLHKFGLEEVADIKENARLLKAVEFTEDLILMPTLERKNRKVKSVEFKYTKRVEYLIKAIQGHYNGNSNDDSSNDLTSESASSVRSAPTLS